MPADAPQHFGNFEANLEFVGATGLVSPGSRVLEIGTGTGSLLHELLARGVHADGVELRQELIDEARRFFGPLPIQRVTGTALPFPDATFDVVISFDVFEHIPDSDAHLLEVRRVLRTGGSYLIQTPNKWTNTLFETIRWRSFTRFREEHCSLHTLGELNERLLRVGFAPRAYDIPVVNDFFRNKVRTYAGSAGLAALRVVNPDRLPLSWRTNFYVAARKTG
ncbi:MAG TPA: class I SAM-dependent methyltransferase [Vicinamibacterales bacterium]